MSIIIRFACTSAHHLYYCKTPMKIKTRCCLFPLSIYCKLLLASFRSLHCRAMSTDRTKQLQELWATSFDAWINVPKHDETIVYLRPQDGVHPSNSSTCRYLPSVVHEVSMFALTGYNPMGEDCASAINRAANRKLRKDLENLMNPRPRYMWNAFGFAKDWREDGFVVAFDKLDKRAGEAAIIALATEYKQGAIYGFEAIDVSGKALLRRTIPVAMTNVEADVVLVPCEKPEGMTNAEPLLESEMTGL